MRSLLWTLVAAANVSLTLAQSTTLTRSPPPTTTSSRPPTTHTVEVGIQHAFRPDVIQANAGDTIRFEFLPTNHSVVKADFGDPCIPYEYHHRNDPTFFSGNRLSRTGDERPIWTLLVNDTNPTFFYCSAPESCLTWKMVGVINPNTTWSLANQLEFHKNTTKFQLSPGEPYPDEAPRPTTTSGPAPTGSSAPSDGGGGGGGGGSTGLSGGAIAGIAIGGVAVLVIAAALVWFCGRRGGIEKGYRRSKAVQPVAPVVEALYNNDPKSPGFQNTQYPSGVPAGHYPSGVPSQHDVYRAGSPSQWSHSQPLNSPHQSYLGQSNSPGIPPYGPGSPLMNGQEQQLTGSTYYSEQQKAPEPAPVELPVHDNQHPSELDSTQTPYYNQNPPRNY